MASTSATTTSTSCVAHVGVIFQDFVRYNFTAAENIAVGRIEAARRTGRGSSAAAAVSLADAVIARLPQATTRCSAARFEGGVDLSGGEWQKIALARAYMRDAQLLILDEPTAALDARAEAEVFQRFKELSRGKTAVLISHRFSTRAHGRPHPGAGRWQGRGRAPTRNCWRAAAAMPSCSSCRRRGTDRFFAGRMAA